MQRSGIPWLTDNPAQSKIRQQTSRMCRQHDFGSQREEVHATVGTRSKAPFDLMWSTTRKG